VASAARTAGDLCRRVRRAAVGDHAMGERSVVGRRPDQHWSDGLAVTASKTAVAGNGDIHRDAGGLNSWREALVAQQ